jgi:hypothetical protein
MGFFFIINFGIVCICYAWYCLHFLNFFEFFEFFFELDNYNAGHFCSLWCSISFMGL